MLLGGTWLTCVLAAVRRDRIDSHWLLNRIRPRCSSSVYLARDRDPGRRRPPDVGQDPTALVATGIAVLLSGFWWVRCRRGHAHRTSPGLATPCSTVDRRRHPHLLRGVTNAGIRASTQPRAATRTPTDSRRGKRWHCCVRRALTIASYAPLRSVATAGLRRTPPNPVSSTAAVISLRLLLLTAASVTS